jgi:hypothetical protein
VKNLSGVFSAHCSKIISFELSAEAFTGSKVQGLHSRRWTAFAMRIYEKSVSFGGRRR